MKDLRGWYAISAIAKEKPEKNSAEAWIFFQASLSQLLKLRINREDLS